MQSTIVQTLFIWATSNPWAEAIVETFSSSIDGVLGLTIIFIFSVASLHTMHESVHDALIHIRALLLCVVTSIMGYVLSSIIKVTTDVERPFQVFNLTPLGFDSLPSFPSTHAVVLVILWYFARKIDNMSGIFVFCASVLILVARIASALHWPLDILAGVLFGYLLAFGMDKIFTVRTAIGRVEN